MALVALNGGFFVPIGAGFNTSLSAPSITPTTIDAANEAAIWIGNICTSDGASHTVDTTGASSFGWRCGTATFVNAGTTVKVGLADVLTTVGPPGRAANVADVITFNVSKSLTGSGITADAWQTHVPDAGTQTVANGDLVAFCIQMTARGGVDVINPATMSVSVAGQRPIATRFVTAAYSLSNSAPNMILTFSDGALGFFYGCDVFTTVGVRTWNSASATKEYGQLFTLPFPTQVYGAYGWVDADADFDLILYSNPLGMPVAEKIVSVDANTVGGTTGARFSVSFAAPYATTTNQNIGIVFKPGAANISTYYRTLASATHRIADPWGANGYGISRAAGAFANANSSLDHYYIGLIAGGFDAGGGGGGRAMQINNSSLVA
jgi:hypothetical protein